MFGVTIVGQIIACCLSVIVILLLLILFLPVRYRADGKFDETFHMKATFLWLMRFCGLTILVKDKKITVRFHILRRRKILYRSGARKKTEAQETKTKKEQNEEEEPLIKTFLQTGKSVAAFLKEKDNRKLIKNILRKLKYLWKHVFPQEIKTRLSFSLGEPDHTGKLVGGISMLPFIYQYDFGLYPDFEAEKAYICGTFHIKGHIRLVHVAIVAVSLLSNKKIRQIIKAIRRKSNE